MFPTYHVTFLWPSKFINMNLSKMKKELLTIVDCNAVYGHISSMITVPKSYLHEDCFILNQTYCKSF